MTTQLADLHLHTRFSDGTDTPTRVLDIAKGAGLSAVAITDHDNTDARTEAAEAATRLGLELIPGIEMSASSAGIEVHILGYYFDPDHAAFAAHLATQQARRVRRLREMVERLGKVGVTLDAEEILRDAGDGTVGRPHVARALLRGGYITSLPEAFSRYLGPKNPGFVPGSPLEPGDIIQTIRSAGGIPVLAHPIYMERDELIEPMVRQGLAGLEVYHSGHGPEAIKRYERMASQLGLLKTGGSDYHGTAKEGAPVGSMHVPYEVVDALKAWKAHSTSAS